MPGVGQQLAPGLGVLGGPEVGGGDLLPRGNVPPGVDLHPPLSGVVTAHSVAPDRSTLIMNKEPKQEKIVNVVFSVLYSHAGMVE